MKEFKRRRNIERATKYRVDYIVVAEKLVMNREFDSHKSLMQWVERNINNSLGLLVGKNLALIDNIWEPYTVIGKKLITLFDLNQEVRLLSEDLDSSFSRK